MVRAADRSKQPRASVWLEGGRARGSGTRGSGRREGQDGGLDRERITGATVRLLDAEGLARFSMRRLAAALDVTAMSLYWYVDTKDDLLELALDAAFGELDLPAAELGGGENGVAPGAGDWRAQLRELATDYRAMLVRHPWISPLAGRFLNIGPHSLAFSLAVQRLMRRSGVPPQGLTGAISAVFQFVYGFGTIEGHFRQRCAEAGMTQDEYVDDAMRAAVSEPRMAGPIGESADLLAARGGATVEEMRERDFRFALDLLIAGIENTVRSGTT
ncbi:TetR/AcrR family transcriptional regulator [Streptomyces sp. NPDC058045]|uniref:TetR/AcrR family transcriptional regulator n=1 Tax=Streptomyces sp. NPDC058045 TaxID=3346311 RepID=UPI0036E16CE0